MACLLKCSKLVLVEGMAFFVKSAAPSVKPRLLGRSCSGLPRTGESLRGNTPNDVGLLTEVFWGCEDVKEDKMEAADCFLTACLAAGAGVDWTLPSTTAAETAVG